MDDVSSHEISASKFCSVWSIFFNKVGRIYEQDNKALIN